MKKGQTVKEVNEYGEFKCSRCGKFSIAKYWCAECKKEYSRQYHEKNKDQIASRHKVTDRKRYYNTDPEIRKKRSRLYYEKNRNKILQRNKQYLQKSKELVIEHYGGKCDCCGETIKEFLSIDHIKGNGKKHRKTIKRKGKWFYAWIVKNNYPSDLRLLCFNCNISTYIYGECPHEKKN